MSKYTVPTSSVGTAIPTKVVGMLVVSTLPTKVVGMQANKQIQEKKGSYIRFVERQINFMIPWQKSSHGTEYLDCNHFFL